MANKEKQQAKVFSTFWDKAVDVCVAPPGNVKAALTAAAKIVNQTRRLSIGYLDLIPEGVTRIEWGDTVMTKGYIKARERELAPKKPLKHVPDEDTPEPVLRHPGSGKSVSRMRRQAR